MLLRGRVTEDVVYSCTHRVPCSYTPSIIPRAPACLPAWLRARPCRAAAALRTPPSARRPWRAALRTPRCDMPACHHHRRIAAISAHLSSCGHAAATGPPPPSAAGTSRRAATVAVDAAAVASIPVIDLRQPHTMTSAQLSVAFETTGFAVLTGMDGAITAASRELNRAAREFFAQPAEAKWSVHIDPDQMEHPDGKPGYLEPGHVSVASLLGDHSSPPDAVECLYFQDLHYFEPETVVGRGVGRQGTAACMRKAPNMAPKWPSQQLRRAVLAYYRHLFALFERLVLLAELALNLPPSFFTPFFSRDMGTSLQLRNYPTTREVVEARETTGRPPNGQMRFGAHTDSGMLTIIQTEQVCTYD
jgi:isopenicillin N synthase-like dioxygenase